MHLIPKGKKSKQAGNEVVVISKNIIVILVQLVYRCYSDYMANNFQLSGFCFWAYHDF